VRSDRASSSGSSRLDPSREDHDLTGLTPTWPAETIRIDVVPNMHISHVTYKVRDSDRPRALLKPTTYGWMHRSRVSTASCFVIRTLQADHCDAVLHVRQTTKGCSGCDFIFIFISGLQHSRRRAMPRDLRLVSHGATHLSLRTTRRRIR
jgi:hypothetical protein